MSGWVVAGLSGGVRTTRYPKAPEAAPGVSPGFPEAGPGDAGLGARCPTGALGPRGEGRWAVDYRRCVHCFRCARGTPAPLAWSAGYEWAGSIADAASAAPLGGAFRRSLHVMVMDAGDCGACLNEVKQLNNPFYNMHRLGFFVTPTPRHADVLLVVGGAVDHLRHALERTYQAMPAPKCVVAVGACALGSGVFGPSFVTGGGVTEVVPVDIVVPGHPPPPLAILHGLLLAAGRVAGASLTAEPAPPGGEGAP
jgi:formate hydrogenlyase subunit 7